MRHSGVIKHLPELKSLLLKLLEGSISPSELSRLVEISRSLVETHLVYLRHNLNYLCSQQGLSITDLSYDCLADAFAKDDADTFVNIENFAASLRSELGGLPDHEVFAAFKAFLTRIADIQLARLYAQADPAGAKIHRNIRDCVKHHPGFSIDRDFRGLILSLKNSDCLEELPPYPSEELEAVMHQHARPEMKIPDLLSGLHNVLASQSRWRRSILLVELVQIVRGLYRGEYSASADEQETLDGEGLSSFEIQQLQNDVEIALKERILIGYLARGKLNRRQAEALFAAFHDMLTDWCLGETGISLHEYLRGHLDVDDETYSSEYRTKMEYLLRVAREEFAARLMREL